MTTKAQQIELDNALVAPENRRVIGKCNMRINPGIKPKEPTYQVVLDALALTTCYLVFLITTEVPVIYMHQFWATVTKHKSSYRFKIDTKKFSVNVKVFRDILNICTRIQGQEFDEPPTEEEALSFIRELGHSREIKYIIDIIEDLAYQIDNIDSKKQDKMFYPRFTKIFIHHFFEKDKSISMRNRTFMHTARDDSLLGTMRFVFRHADTQVYGAIIPNAMTNQALLDSVAYKTYHAIASGSEPSKSMKSQKKSDSAISSEESPSKKKSAKVKKVATAKPKPTKKKAPVKADRGKDDGTGFESGVPDEQHHKTTGADKGTEEDEDDENDSEDKSDDGDDDDDGNDGNDDDDANDDDNQEGDDMNDDDEETDKEEENIDDEETMDDEVTKELYKDVNVNLGNKDTEMTNADQGNNDEQPADKEVSKDDWFKKPERPLTPDSNWNKRQHVDF
ncbi:hypothetical protein Tco_0901744 [Tanacetum coccineum]